MSVTAIALMPLTGAASAQAAAPVITVYSPSAHCTIDFDYQSSVVGSAWLLHQTNVTAYYSADLLLWYGGAWHTVLRTASTSTQSNWVQVPFSPTNNYSWTGYTAIVRLWVWNNYGAGWKWYPYDTNSCVVNGI